MINIGKVLTTITLVGDHNILVLFASGNFQMAFTGIRLTICTTDFFTFTFNYHHVLVLYDAVGGTDTQARLANTLTFTDRVEFTSYVGTSAYMGKSRGKVFKSRTKAQPKTISIFRSEIKRESKGSAGY